MLKLLTTLQCHLLSPWSHIVFNINHTNLVTSYMVISNNFIPRTTCILTINTIYNAGCVGNITVGNKSSSAIGNSIYLVNPDGIIMSDTAFTIAETYLVTQNATTNYLPTPVVNGATNTTNVSIDCIGMQMCYIFRLGILNLYLLIPNCSRILKPTLQASFRPILWTLMCLQTRT